MAAVTASRIGEPLDAGRRAFVAAAMSAFGPALASPDWAFSQAQAAEFWRRPRRLVLTHAASGEQIDATYWSDGELIIPEYTRLSYFMRDRVTGTGVYMHPVLLDILYAVGGWLVYFGIREPIVLNSGYRDPKRNVRIEGAVRGSRHTTGDAGDIAIPRVNALQVARFGAWLGGGGVGWYPDKFFTHLDRGQLRTWRG